MRKEMWQWWLKLEGENGKKMLTFQLSQVSFLVKLSRLIFIGGLGTKLNSPKPKLEQLILSHLKNLSSQILVTHSKSLTDIYTHRQYRTLED